MKSFSRSLMIICVVVLTFVAARSLPNNERQFRALKIATLDIEQVIDDFLNRTGDLEKLVNEKKAKQRSFQGIAEEVTALESEASIYPEGSEKYYRILTQAQTKRFELRAQSEAAEKFYSRREGTLIKEVYEKATKVIETYCQEKGLDMVVLKTSPQIPGSSRQAASSAVIVRGVVYATDSVDITDDIKERMK